MYIYIVKYYYHQTNFLESLIIKTLGRESAAEESKINVCAIKKM